MDILWGGPSCSPLHPGSLNPYPNKFYLIQKRKGYFKKMRDKWGGKKAQETWVPITAIN